MLKHAPNSPPVFKNEGEESAWVKSRLRWLADALTDDAKRSPVAMALERLKGTSIMDQLVDELILKLKQVGDADCPRIVGGIVALGSESTRRLQLALSKTKANRWRVRLVRSLGAVARAVPDNERIGIFLTLDSLMTDAAPEVRAAGARAVFDFRSGDKTGSPPG